MDDRSQEAFHHLVSDLDYPMFIVTAAAGDERGGCLVGFASQCSINPSRWWVGMSKKNHTTRLVHRADNVVLHVPGPGDLDLAEHFGTTTGDRIDKLAGVAWHPGPDGTTPVLDRCGRWFAARIVERLDTGDHVTLVVEPFAAADDGPAGQLGFQRVKHLDAGHEA